VTDDRRGGSTQVRTSRRMAGIEKTLIRRMNDLADESCINLGLGELRFPTPHAILDHVRAHIEAWRLGYTPNEGLRELRQLIAVRSGIGGETDRVCVTVGAQEALFAVLMVLVDAGDEVLIPDPGFPPYASIVKMAGGIPRTYDLSAASGFAPDVAALDAAMSPKTAAVVINSPHNPTGAVYDEEFIRAVAELCDARGIPVISDEVYAAIYFEKIPAFPRSFSENVITIDSLSKAFSMTGWRLGWCVVPPELVQPLAAFHQLSVTCASAVSQHAAIFALKGGADAEKDANLRELALRRDIAIRCLKTHGLAFIEPAGAFYIMVDVAEGRARFGNSFDLAKTFLAREKVVTIPGSAFGERGEGYLRLSFAAAPNDIEEGIGRLARFLRS
jgi:aspartate aminotransferase